MKEPKAPGAAPRSTGLRRAGPRAAALGAAFLAGAALTAALLKGVSGLSIPWPPSLFGGTRLLVVGLDGADWNILDPLMARGELPHLRGLVERGSRGRLMSFQPMLSPVLWTTIATGVRPERHGIVDFIAVAPATGEAIPVTSNLRTAPAFWNILSDAGISVGVTAWWATFPAEEIRGYMVSDRIAYQLFGVKPDDRPEGKTWPADLWKDVRALVVDPASVEAAALGRYLGPAPGRPVTAEERDLENQLRALIAAGETYDRIAGSLARRFRPEVEVVYIQDTDTVSHLVMKYREPLLPGVAPELARRFGPAVDEAYRQADRRLGEAMERAGAGANVMVLSDHGFRSGADRPVSTESRIDRGKAADWHRKYGILVLAGPDVRQGAEIREASLLDIAPTILALAGQPIPEDFQGRVLAEAFTERFLREHPVRPAPPVGRPEAGGDRAKGTEADAANAAALEKLVSLGYLSQDSLNARNNRGILHMNRGEYAEAIREFTSALAEQPNQPGILINLGRSQWLSGDPAAGRATLRRAIALDPRAREAENVLGNLEMAEGNLPEAERHFRRSIEIEPDYTDGHNSLGILFEEQERWEEALAQYRRVIEVDPDYGEGYNNIGNVLKRLGRGAEAESWYRRAIEADPSFAGSYNNLALMLQDRGELDEAEKLYRESLARAPDEPKTHNNLGSLHFRRGEIQKALASFQKAAELDPKYAEARNSLGVVYGALGRAAEEEAAYREALRLRPDYADARYNLAMLLIRRGGGDEGLRELERTLSASPRHVPSLIAMSEIERGRGRPRQALDLAGRAVKADPLNAAARVALAQALAASGDAAGARDAAREALRLDPSSEAARQLL